MDRIGVAICDLGFDSCHRSASVRTSQVPSAYSEEKKNLWAIERTTWGQEPPWDEESRFRGGETVGGCRDQTPLVRGGCAEVVLPLPEDPAGRCSFPGQKLNTWPHPNKYENPQLRCRVLNLKRPKGRGQSVVGMGNRLVNGVSLDQLHHLSPARILWPV